MNAGTRKSPFDNLLARGHQFSFIQAIRLLRQACRQQGLDFSAIKIRPKLSLGFPAADIDRIVPQKGNKGRQYAVTANFLGLYGVSSPLPLFYTEDLIDERNQDESVSREFLDIFNRRLYDLLFQCWSKYRLFFKICEEQESTELERLFCLLGLGSEPLRRGLENPQGLIRYLGLLTQFPRSAAGLATLLSDALKNVPVTIVACIARKARLASDQRFSLGRDNCRLGGSSYLGDQIKDRMGKFRIRIGPLDQETFLYFTPGNQGYRRLAELTALYLNQPLECEVELVMDAGQARTISLGRQQRACLGVNTWVFSGKTIEQQAEIRFAVLQTSSPGGGDNLSTAKQERMAS